MTSIDHFSHPARRMVGRVEVRCAFDGSWSRGFEIASIVVGKTGVVGYHLRRMSDRAVLPAVFAVENVRGDPSSVLA
jgi:hypothetical protein